MLMLAVAFQKDQFKEEHPGAVHVPNAQSQVGQEKSLQQGCADKLSWNGIYIKYMHLIQVKSYSHKSIKENINKNTHQSE